MAANLMDRIVVDPAVMVGKPVVRGTRIPVEIVLEKLALELDVEEILLDYPLLTRDDIRACVEYAHALVAGEDVFPQPAEHLESAV
jgi:uncharacterized protein (DUF433 family)